MVSSSEGRKEKRKKGRDEERKEGRKEGREGGRKKEMKEGRKEGRRCNSSFAILIISNWILFPTN